MTPQPLRRKRASRAAFTLIEVLTVIGVIGILAGLLMPAVQSSREAARRLACANNLRQIGFALHQYEGVYQGFPPSTTAGKTAWPGRFEYFSVHTLLLPYLEQNPLYQSINFNLPSSFLVDLDGGHATAASQTVRVFLCPSDPFNQASPYGANNYRANLGISFDYLRDDQGGAFHYGSPNSAAGFRDGLSSTLAFSEKPTGSLNTVYSPFRDWVLSPVSATTPDDWVRVCSNLANPPAPQVDQYSAGRTWMISTTLHTQFLATAPPNTSVPDCGRVNPEGLGVFSARSYHPGAVEALLADGSVRTYSSQTNASVWRALGTRAGSEIVNE